jgi:hypothetical protein
VVATAWAVTENGWLALMTAVGAFHTIIDKPSDEPDSGALFQYAILVVTLSVMIYVPPPAMA